MNVEQFCKNNRGLNDGQDFSTEYLSIIYRTIREDEILMPEEHEGDLGYQYQWTELIKRSNKDNTWYECSVSLPEGSQLAKAYDRDIFEIIWRSTVPALINGKHKLSFNLLS